MTWPLCKTRCAVLGGGRILLVWPGNKPMFSRKLDVTLLQRHSQAQGTELFLVTRDPEVRYYANELEIPVFRSLRKAQKSPWQGSSVLQTEEPPLPDIKRIQQLRKKVSQIKTQEKGPKPWQRYAALVVGMLAFVAVLGLLLPSAEVRLQPVSETQSITLDVQANPQVSNFNLSGAVPVQEISVTVEDSQTRASSGQIGIPQNRAAGEVVFTNITDQAVTIPIGTIVRTLGNEPIRFSVTETGELAAEAGTNVALSIEAVNPGVTGNQPANSLISIDGPLGLSLSVTNPEATSGGNDQTSPAPSTEDYTTLRSDLLDALIDQAIQQTRTDFNEQDIILPVQSNDIEILEETFDPADVQPATELSLTIRAVINVHVVRWADLTSLAQAVLNAGLPEGFEAIGEPLTIEQISEPGLNDDGLYTWQLQIQQEIQTPIDSNAINTLVRGATPQQASQILANTLALESAPEVNMQPAWWPWIPLVPFRVTVASN